MEGAYSETPPPPFPPPRLPRVIVNEEIKKVLHAGRVCTDRALETSLFFPQIKLPRKERT